MPVARVRVRARSIRAPRITRRERAEAVPYPADVERPRTRGDCAELPRPCPFVSCAHHLYLDVNPRTGTIKVNFPHLAIEEMPETCSLDVAERGGVTLEEVGEIMNLTRERVRQLEVRAIGDAVAAWPEAPHRW